MKQRRGAFASRRPNCQKSLAEFALAGAKKVKSVFARGVYAGENTSRGASVELSALWRTTEAQGASPLSKKSLDFFDKLSAGERLLPGAVLFSRQSLMYSRTR